ncbi:MAG: tetratricopeptide repeat protein [Wenzhouxiangellaceae bacterium]|nr:tetratricopeptide repeat protein [Wenzhouxiangellaceae bacterium]
MLEKKGRRIRDARQTTSLLLGQPASEPARAPSELAADDPEAEFPASRLRGDLDAICSRALAEDPEQRYETASALGADLDNWLGQRPVEAYPGGNLYRAGKWFRRHRATAAWGLALVIALVGGTGAALWQGHRAELAAAQARENALVADDARARAEAALARADAINEFLVELFQADIPRVPEDEMPTTRQVVETGIERARDPATGPPEVRASLLLALGNVILHHLEPDRAEALLRDAGELLDEHGIDNPRILVDQALLRADIAMVRDQADKVADAADEAIELLRAHRPGSLELLEIMRLRAQAERRIGTLADARERFEDVYALTEGRDDAALLRLSLAQDLAVISGMEKDFHAALEQFEEVLRLKRARDDTIPNQLATTEYNIAYTLVELGEFERARNRLQQTLEYLAEIDAPNPVRASALLTTGEIHRLQGRLEPALEMYREGAREWARVKGLESIDDDYLIHYRTAIALAAAGRIEAAAENMQRAIERMEHGDRHHPPQRIAGARAMLAELHCRGGMIQAARSLLAAVDGQLDPASSPELARARAECSLADPEGDPDPALVPPAVIEEHARAPGRAIETAGLELVRARLLALTGQPAEARVLIESARARLDPLALSDGHPLIAELHGVRQHLSAP